MKQVLITTNPQGVDVVSVGLAGQLIEERNNKALIRFENEFGEFEEWYFELGEFVKL
jgi:hypothetical protein